MKNTLCLKLVKVFQETSCLKTEKVLLDFYFLPVCNFAHKFLINNVYSNLLQFDRCEVESAVYLAFRKALLTYKFGDLQMSFKNYLYQSVKFEMFRQMRTCFNWQMIPNFEQQKAIVVKEAKNTDVEKKYLKQIDVKNRVNAIFLFLKNNTKKSEYSEIWRLKCEGWKNKEICKKLNLTPDEVKSKFQYIKRIVLNNFGYWDWVD